LESRFTDAWAPVSWQGVTVLLAVSGGADSVALLRVMAAVRPQGPQGAGRLAVAHLNHQWRGNESDADEAFVIDLCRQLGVPCEVGRVALGQPASNVGDGLEAAARAARYQFLGQTAARLGARYVVTAHTADDQAETILHRIVRGTGIGGLAGMARTRPLDLPLSKTEEKKGSGVVSSTPVEVDAMPAKETTPDPLFVSASATLTRPLLPFRRAELVAYLEDLGQPYRRDASNDDVRFTRNRIRHQLLPRLAEEFSPGVVEALLRLGTLAAEVQEVVDALVGDLFEQAVTIEGPQSAEVDAALAAKQSRYVVRELLMSVWRAQTWPLRSMGFAQWEMLTDMLLAAAGNASSKPAKQAFPGNVLAAAGGGALRLTRQEGDV
jgi:tRNA(Ile)-lysidine synthase